jgi:hypothetical protein
MVGDYIVYLTIKGKYHPHHEEHWRLVAVLKVEGKLHSHPAAAAWYRSASLPLPRNLMVPANPAV